LGQIYATYGAKINIPYIYVYILPGNDEMPPKEAFEVVYPYPPTLAQPGAKTFSSTSSETREQALSNGEILILF
jgi:hypothetical protein